MPVCIQDWHHSNKGWHSGTNAILPFLHSALELFAFGDGIRLAFVCRERGRLTPPTIPHIQPVAAREFDTILSTCKNWPLDWQIIELNPTSVSAPICVSAGSLGNSPLYLHVQHQKLNADWDLAMLAKSSGASLDLDMAAHFLLGSIPYGHRTMFTGINMLTQNSTAIVTADCCMVHYPIAAEVPCIREPHLDTDIVVCFERLLTDLIRRATGSVTPQHMVELSGGLDSAIVATFTSKLAPQPLHSYGLQIPGPNQTMQRRRREQLVNLLGLQDHPTLAETYPPLMCQSPRWQGKPIAPLEEIYSEAFGAMLDAAVVGGIQVALTGIGGDELFMPTISELSGSETLDKIIRQQINQAPAFVTTEARQRYSETFYDIERAPRSHASISTFISKASRAALFMRRGIWCIHPLAMPEAVQFCQSLPLHWRQKKRLSQEVMEHLGANLMSTRATHPETFHFLFNLGLKGKAASYFLSNYSMLDTPLQGLIDGSKLADVYHTWFEGNNDIEPFIYYQIAILTLTSRERC